MENQNDINEGVNLLPDYSKVDYKLISFNKFIFLCIISFGTYEIWWLFKEWKFFKEKDKLDIMPAARALFSIFFLNSLLDMILGYAKSKGYKDKYTSVSLVIGFFISNLLSRLPMPFGLVSVLSFVFLIPPFKASNYAKLNSTEFIAIEQSSFNTRQIVLIIVGSLFWALLLIGITLGDV